MPLVQYVITALACQVEDFPATVAVEGGEPRKFERSCEGALHVRPGGSAEITADEFAHIREQHPKVASHVRVLVTDEQLAASRAAPTEPPPPAPPSDDEDDAIEGDVKKKSGKR